MAHFYLAEELTEAESGSVVRLTGAEAKHAALVSRLAVGETVSIGNGAGLVVRGEVLSAGRDLVEVRADQVMRVEPSGPRIVLAQALAKGDRDELAVQAATELGVDEVVPWAAGRSISRWDAVKAVKGRERWSSIAREAAKQAMRPHLPVVSPLLTTKQLAALAPEAHVVVLEPTATSALTDLEPDGRDLVVVVGPEGGIAPDELELLEGSGATLARLGTTVLRTSTAGPAAIAVLSAKLRRW